jgi:hypothetical protein
MSNNYKALNIQSIQGIYNSEIQFTSPSSKISLDIYPLDLIAHWKRCAITANFISSFTPFKHDNEKSQNIISTIINELIENAVKFAYDKTEPIYLTICKFDSAMTIEVTNIANKQSANKLNKLADKIQNKNIEELFFERIKEAYNLENASGLGLITLIKNLNTKLGFKIQQIDKDNDELFNVSIKVLLEKKEIDKL